MSVTITGRSLDWTGAVAPGTVESTPLDVEFVNQGGTWVLVDEPGPVGAVDAVTGNWSVTLPDSTTQYPSSASWSLQLPNGVAFGGSLGSVPAGTYTQAQIRTYGWGLITDIEPIILRRPPTQFQVVTGPAGPAGPLSTWRGTWSSGATYATNDEVFYAGDGSGYIAVASSTNVTPGTDTSKWQKYVQAGAAGPSAPDASTSTKGIALMSTAPASSTSPIAVGDNDTRMTNARAPTGHAGTHLTNGSDAISWASVLIRGNESARPTAASTNSGYVYWALDTGNVYQSTGSAWVTLRLGDRVLAGTTGGASLQLGQYGEVKKAGGTAPTISNLNANITASGVWSGSDHVNGVFWFTYGGTGSTVNGVRLCTLTFQSGAFANPIRAHFTDLAGATANQFGTNPAATGGASIASVVQGASSTTALDVALGTDDIPASCTKVYAYTVFGY